MNVQDLTPVLRIFDEAKAKEFYVDFLEFTVDWEHRHEEGLPVYMQVSKNGCAIHLSEHHGDVCPGGAVRLRMDDVDGYQQHLAAKDYKFARPGSPTDQPWGSREVDIIDPFGNTLTFHKAID